MPLRGQINSLKSRAKALIGATAKTIIMTTKEQNSPKESEMQRLLEDKQYFNLPKVGDLVKGTIISSDKSEVHIDLGGVATGIVRGRERYGEAEEYRNLKPGDEVEATVMELENETGELELSFRYAGRQKAWQNISQFEKDGTIIEALIIDANKGGLMIRVENTPGFLPVSQLAPEHYPRVPGGDKNRILEILKSYVGNKFEVKIIDAKEGEDKLIVSEKAAWEETQKETINKYKVDNIVEGTVTAITDFGVFVEFSDKLEGLIHISEIAWQRIDDPNDFVKVGQKIKAEIIDIQNSKIFLSMKKLAKDPWDGLDKKFTIGDKVKGKVIKANPFGLFVEIAADIQGLAHISQLSDKEVDKAEAIAKPGEEKDFYIVSMDIKNHRLGLSLVKPKKEEVKPAAEPTEEKKTAPAADQVEKEKEEKTENTKEEPKEKKVKKEKKDKPEKKNKKKKEN